MTTIACPLREAAQISRQEGAIFGPDRDLLYSEWDELATRVAANLKQLGLGPGDRIALFLPQDWRYPVILMGVIRAGAVACPLSTRQPRDAVIDQLRWINCRAVVAYSREAQTSEDLPCAQLHPDTLLAEPESRVSPEAIRYALDQPATILFTSGSTGDPKAVQHSIGNHYYSARGSNNNLRIRSHDRWLMQVPIYHVSGLSIVFRCMLSGAGIAMPGREESLVEAISGYGATHLSLVPTQLRRLLADPEAEQRMKKIKAILLGGSALDEQALKQAFHRGWPVYPTYGLTEMASQVTTVPVLTPPERRYYAGSPLAYRELQIALDGEILVRGSCLFQGYVQGDAVDPAVDAEGWFHTGDLGTLDEEQRLKVNGRKDDMFISGGENIHPAVIERAMMNLGGIDRVLVVPVTDKEFGQRPVAFVLGSQRTAEAWPALLRPVLAGFQIPVAFLAWPEGESWQSDKPNRENFALLAEAMLAR